SWPSRRPVTRGASAAAGRPSPAKTGGFADSTAQGARTPSAGALSCCPRRYGGTGMKALVYDGPGRRSWTDHADPEQIDPTDAIVRIDAVTICGTDLHILKGDVPTVDRRRNLG